MPRMKSELKESVEKLLEQAGMFKEAYPSLDAYKDDPEARAGSDDLTTIESLYGVKPDASDEMEYAQNIMEVAHKQPVIIAPSYDKINGLVENNIERNQIMINITRKPNTGNHTNPKYAHQELVLELVRVANEMDSRNKEELFKLADSCLIDLSACQRRVKTALAPLAIGGIVLAAAAVLGAVWLVSHTDNVDHGPLANADEAIKKLNDLKTNSWYESDVDETVQKEADNLISHIEQLKMAIEKFNKVADYIYKPRTLTELKDLVKLKNVAASNGDAVLNTVKEFKSKVVEIVPLINQAIDNFSSDVYQKSHTKPSSVADITGWLGEALHGRWGLVANDFISVTNALNPLKNSLIELIGKVENFDKVMSKYENDIRAASAEVENKTGKNPMMEAGGARGAGAGGANDNEVGIDNIPSTGNMPNNDRAKQLAEMIKKVTGKDATPEELEFLNTI